MEKQSQIKYGSLLTTDIKYLRKSFEWAVKTIGIICQYRYPLTKRYDLYGDLDATYSPEEPVGCIFQEHPNQRTFRKKGWAVELQENASIIQVPYDLKNLQEGALFKVPSGLDNGEGRWFRVIKMYTSMIYPSSIVCEIAPEYFDNVEPVLIKDTPLSGQRLLNDVEGDD